MGQYVTRKDPKTGKDRKYYKADNGKLYNDYNAAASANMNPVARVQRWAGEKLGGLFSTPKAPNYTGPVGDSTDPIFDDKGKLTPAAKTILEQSNTGAQIIRRDDRHPMAKLAEQTNPWEYGNRAYANTYSNKTYVNGQNLGTLVHELGHLDRSQRQGFEHITQGLGVAGRALTELGKLPLPAAPIQPLNVVAGLSRSVFDAAEEDVAERYRKTYSPKLFRDAQTMQPPGPGYTSRYGDSERAAGNETLLKGLDPSGLIRGGIDFAHHNVIGPIQEHGRQQRITELTKQHQQDQARFSQLPDDTGSYSQLQNSFVEEASRRLEELERLKSESGTYKNLRQQR